MRCAEIDSTMKKGLKETSFGPFLQEKIEYRSCAGGFPAKKEKFVGSDHNSFLTKAFQFAQKAVY
jgi:hypothetical protein